MIKYDEIDTIRYDSITFTQERSISDVIMNYAGLNDDYVECSQAIDMFIDDKSIITSNNDDVEEKTCLDEKDNDPNDKLSTLPVLTVEWNVFDTFYLSFVSICGFLWFMIW